MRASSENQTGEDQDLLAGDVTVRLGPGSCIKAEAARTDGPGFGEQNSLNDGFTSGDVPQARDGHA